MEKSVPMSGKIALMRICFRSGLRHAEVEVEVLPRAASETRPKSVN